MYFIKINYWKVVSLDYEYFVQSEACRNQHAQNLKNRFKAVAGVAGTAACVVVTVATAEKINPKK